MSQIYVDPPDIDPVDGVENFDTSTLQLWLDPDGWEDGLSPAETVDADAEFQAILTLYPESPPPTQTLRDKLRRSRQRLRDMLDRIRRFRGKLWQRMSEVHKQKAKQVIEDLLKVKMPE